MSISDSYTRLKWRMHRAELVDCLSCLAQISDESFPASAEHISLPHMHSLFRQSHILTILYRFSNRHLDGRETVSFVVDFNPLKLGRKKKRKSKHHSCSCLKKIMCESDWRWSQLSSEEKKDADRKKACQSHQGGRAYCCAYLLSFSTVQEVSTAIQCVVESWED